MTDPAQDAFDRVSRVEAADIAPGDTILVYLKQEVRTADFFDHLDILRLQMTEQWPENKVSFFVGVDHVEILRPENPVVGS